MLSEQDNALATGSEKFKKAKEDLRSVKDEAETNIKVLNENMKR